MRHFGQFATHCYGLLCFSLTRFCAVLALCTVTGKFVAAQAVNNTSSLKPSWVDIGSSFSQRIRFCTLQELHVCASSFREKTLIWTASMPSLQGRGKLALRRRDLIVFASSWCCGDALSKEGSLRLCYGWCVDQSHPLCTGTHRHHGS